MTRLIKRYGSRKLYDTQESRYVLLEEIAAWIREGQDISVVDNKTNENVTALTLTQVISEEGRKKSSLLSTELLHDLIRAGETAVNTRVKQIQQGVDRFVKKSIDRIVPLASVRDEMSLLRQRLDELEAAVKEAESATLVETPAPSKTKAAKAAASKTDSDKTKNSKAGTAKKVNGTKTARKPAARKTASPRRGK
jgi:polyhydroxyalkanoate synthesis repressor PhaR